MKWIPLVFLPLLAPAARRRGLAFLGAALLLSLATWPQTLEQFTSVTASGLPSLAHGLRGLRLDHAAFLWAVVPWLWMQLDAIAARPRRAVRETLRRPAVPRSSANS